MGGGKAGEERGEGWKGLGSEQEKSLCSHNSPIPIMSIHTKQREISTNIGIRVPVEQMPDDSNPAYVQTVLNRGVC